MIFSIKNISVMCIIAILLIALLVKSCENKQLRNHVEKTRIPDTVFVKKPYKVIEIKTEYIEKPVKVFVYLKDTTLRKEAEHSDIVLGVDIKRKNIFSNEDIIKVDKITPLGIVMSSEYPLPTFREIKIDEHGNLEVKKKRFPKLRKVLRIVLIGAAGFIIGREVSTIK
jgi:hypothetical protein